MATFYAYAITKNYPFMDGNKRTAYVVCLLFLKLNGKFLSTSPEEKYRTFLHLADGSLDENAVSSLFADYIQEVNA
jgi:death on curing protein